MNAFHRAALTTIKYEPGWLRKLSRPARTVNEFDFAFQKPEPEGGASVRGLPLLTCGLLTRSLCFRAFFKRERIEPKRPKGRTWIVWTLLARHNQPHDSRTRAARKVECIRLPVRGIRLDQRLRQRR